MKRIHSIYIALLTIAEARWPIGMPVQVKNIIRPTIDTRKNFDAVQEAWNSFDLLKPDPQSYIVPPIPPLVNPALARQPYKTVEWNNPGIANLIWYDPNFGPPSGSLPLIPPTVDRHRVNAGEGNSPNNFPWEPLPMPSSFKYKNAASDYGNGVWSMPAGLTGYPAQ